MGPPVVSAMLTTVAAFLPLFMIKGIIGEIIAAIPMVVVAVLIASLIEVFFILPAHLAHFVKSSKEKPLVSGIILTISSTVSGMAHFVVSLSLRSIGVM